MSGAIKITVIGDEGVGKTSLITTAATESFPEQPPPLLPPTRLPPETTSEHLPILVTDTSSKPEGRQALEQAVTQADVVVVLFDTGDRQTVTRISSYWMPQLQQLGVQCPVILCGCKSDLQTVDPELLQEFVAPIMGNYRQIETCVECSARNLVFTGEVFSYAVKAVVNPVRPLFDPHAQEGEGQLKELCVRALRRVFTMCDQDQDGILSDEELSNFQIKCFSAPLQPEELSGVKAVVAAKMPQGVQPNGLTLAGFLFLHALFIERGRLEATWTVLRKFGYDNTLHLHPDILDSVSFARTPDQGVELTDVALIFLTTCMQQHDADGDGSLSPAEQEALFSTAPDMPWEQHPYSSSLVPTNQVGYPTIEGCLMRWRLMAALDPRKTLADILYLGFDGDPSALFTITKPRRQERKPEQRTRTVFRCLMCGPRHAGKSTLLHGMAGCGREELQPCTYAVTSVPLPGGATSAAADRDNGAAEPSVTLIASEKDDPALERLLESPSAAGDLAHADVAAFVFDSSSQESFRCACISMLRVAEASGNSLPCMLVAAKDDLPMSRELEADCGAACAKLGISPPVGVSRSDMSDLPAQILATALRPSGAIPETPSLQVARQYRRMLKTACVYVGVGAAIAAAGYAVYSFVNASSKEQVSGATRVQDSRPQGQQLQQKLVSGLSVASRS